MKVLNLKNIFILYKKRQKKLGGVFFSETGEGRDLDLEDIEVCDLGRKDKEIWDNERWDNMYIFVDYMFDGNSVSVKFDKYEYDTQIFEEYETQKEVGTLKTRPIEELWKELNIPE